MLTPFNSVTIQPEQHHVLEKAAEEGYYRTPRETTLDELATELECPRSTVSYRLRRAEAALVDEYLTNNS
ncbi:helix-turn-helix domain-containing protein [Halorientalis sp.]|uniref:helix-turn-helix domain-containing protein n=1 Tax=Halorientalis sp. TaxID=1931229 RepID=UPI0026053BDC|nr:helix-turn-helix domain-containing protein [Halorientalis sp.]